MKYLQYIVIATILLTASCVEQPAKPSANKPQGKIEAGVLISCEGIWGMDNASMDVFDLEAGRMTNNYFAQANPGRFLGDLAQSVTIKGDTAFVAVTTSNTIEVLSASSGKSLGRIRFAKGNALREIVIVNDSLAIVTDLYGHSVHLFNPSTFIIIDNSIKVGPAPEGIINIDDKIFVANSGYGDYLANEPLAGYLSVIDANSLAVIANIYCGPNATGLAADTANGRIYAAYRNLPSKENALGGIIEFDAQSLAKLREWKLGGDNLDITFADNILYALNGEGIWAINTRDSEAITRLILENKQQKQYWYAIAVDSDNKLLYIANARNYQVEGELLIYTMESSPKLLRVYSTGINPGDIQLFDIK